MKINTNLLNKLRYTLYAPAYNWPAKLLDTSRKKAIAQLNPLSGEKILIVGGGTGMDLDYLPLGCIITATDITPAMIRQIEKRNRRLKHQLKVQVMDGQRLSFENETFDKIILHLIVSVIPDPILTVLETERVLKPGGKISVYDKFVHKNNQPSLLRKTLNLFTNLFFSDITRSFEQIVTQTQLKVISDEPADFGGNFRIILLEK